MRVEKYVCDKCKQDIPDGVAPTCVSFSFLTELEEFLSWDLCSPCATKVQGFIEAND